MIDVEPIALTEDTAVLRRRDYDALIQACADAAETVALAEVQAREAAGDTEYVQSSSPRGSSSRASIRFGSGASIAV
jgi:hypothetical protein